MKEVGFLLCLHKHKVRNEEKKKHNWPILLFESLLYKFRILRAYDLLANFITEVYFQIDLKGKISEEHQ